MCDWDFLSGGEVLAYRALKLRHLMRKARAHARAVPLRRPRETAPGARRAAPLTLARARAPPQPRPAAQAFRHRDNMITHKEGLHYAATTVEGGAKGWIQLEPTPEVVKKDRKTRERQRRRRKKNPKILMTIEVLPKEVATERPSGVGRDAPNAFPTLPEPKRPPAADMVFVAFRSLWVRAARRRAAR